MPFGARARLIADYGPGSRAAKSGRQRYFSGPTPGLRALVFNPRRPLFAQAAMRRAVNYALDRPALARDADWPGPAGRPTDQHIPPGWPGFRDANIYPLGGPDLPTARRLTGGAKGRGVLYACNDPRCLEDAEIVRANLAAIGIDLEIRRFSHIALFERHANPNEPFDLLFSGWLGALPDPSDFMDAMFDYNGTTGFLDHTQLGPRMRAVGRLVGAARIDAYAALDRDIAAQEAPFAPIYSTARTDFFSSRIGCQVEHPLYGIDLAALCVRV